nr:hypothetical protein [Pirellulaceae bacterium]
MNRYLALRHLCWKEIRQVLPLVWMQLGLGVCFQLLLLFQPNDTFVFRFLVFAGMPVLFALGVGALLVGQEKERRTLDWLRSLPIAAVDLVAVKLAAGIFALLAVWCLNLLLLAIFILPTGRWPVASLIPADPGWEYLWPLQSVFLLFAGFATAWIFRSSLVALLTLIPLSLLPGMFSLALNGPAPWMMVLALIVLSLPLLVVGWRRGIKSLAPEHVSERRFVWNRAQEVPLGEPEVWTRPTHVPAAMLIWQFVGQNQTLLKGIAAMLFVALGLLITTPSVDSGRPALAAFLGLLAASWLGVLAFQGDGMQERIRFLAERGVSPAKIWWTRHAPALSLLATALTLMVLFLPAYLRSEFLSTPGLLFVVAVLFTYAVSQAVGQVFRSPTIAAIAAPVGAWMLAAYGVSLVALVAAPYWLLAMCALFPWLATFLLMRRWMDGRLGWGFWGA